MKAYRFSFIAKKAKGDNGVENIRIESLYNVYSMFSKAISNYIALGYTIIIQ